MKKRVYGKKLSRGRGSRKALFRSLIRALVENGSIKTTKAKAKAIQGDIDGLVNMAKDGSVAKRRMIYAALANDKKTTNRLINVIAKKLKGTTSGYTRIIPLPQRRGDMAEMARLEWVKDIKEEKSKKSEDAKEEKESKGVKEKLKSVAKRGKKSAKSRSSSGRKSSKEKKESKSSKKDEKKSTKKSSGKSKTTKSKSKTKKKSSKKSG